MRKTLIILSAALLAAACHPEDRVHDSSGTSRQPGGRTPADPVQAEGLHTYLTAVRFPDGYDWESDSCAVDGTVLIDLYRDGELIRSIPAGESVHPDMHRFAGGHLYTDYSTGTETVVACDGTELFRFGGREALRGFLVREDGVHTLGQDRDGTGFTYRIDGREVFRSETGTVLGSLDRSSPAGGALMPEGDDAVYYACRLPSERGQEYRVMRNAERYRTLAESDGVRDLIVVGGRVCRVQSKPRKLVLDVDGTETVLGLRGGESARWCRMVAWQDDILVLVCASGAGGKRYFLQTAGGASFQAGDGDIVTDVLADSRRMGWTVTDGSGLLWRVRWSDGSQADIPPGGCLASGRCALLHEGRLLLALTGRNGTPNRFVTDTESTDFPFNGYFTSVTVE